VAVATLGGALAVRAKKRKQTTPPVPPEVKPRPAVAAARPAETVESDPARALVRMAIGAGIFVVLAIAVVVATAPRGDGTTTPRPVMSPSVGPDGMYTQVAVPGPVGQDERVALTGDGGARVEIGIRPAGERLTPGVYPGQRNLVFTVHLRNTGTIWVGTRLDLGAWVLDATGANYRANQMLSLEGGPDGSTDPRENPDWRLEPGWEADRQVVFTVPQDVRPIRLHLVVPMGAVSPTAEWNLEPLMRG